MKTSRSKNCSIGWVQEQDSDSGVVYFSPEIFDNLEHIRKSGACVTREEAIARLEKGIAMTEQYEELECAEECHVIGGRKYPGWVKKKDETGVTYFSPEAFNHFETACKSIAAWDKKGVINLLKQGIEKTKKQKMPSPKDLIALPLSGQKIWVLRDNGNSGSIENKYQIFDVTVAELTIYKGEVRVVFGSYFVKKEDWFFTKKEAERHRLKLIKTQKKSDYLQLLKL